MESNNKTYGFTIAIKELKETVPNIFRYATAFKRSRNITSTGLWNMFLDKPKPPTKDELEEARRKKAEKSLPEEILQSKPGDKGALDDVDPYAMQGEKYNMCHFWSNFEIANLDWFRGRDYNDFFEAMDRSGGFWMERVRTFGLRLGRGGPTDRKKQWGDAPIHSLAAGLLLDTPDLHYFRDFGYRHTTIQHCPANAPGFQLPPLPLAGEEAATTDAARRRKTAAEDAYWRRPDAPRENGVGCRYRCDADLIEVEGKEGGCLIEWVNAAGGWTS
jgi:mannosyltransferase